MVELMTSLIMATLRFTDNEMLSDPYMKELIPYNMHYVPSSLDDLACLACEKLHTTSHMVNTKTGVIWWRFDMDSMWYELKIWCGCGCNEWQNGIAVRATVRAKCRNVKYSNGLITTKHREDNYNKTHAIKVRFN